MSIFSLYNILLSLYNKTLDANQAHKNQEDLGDKSRDAGKGKQKGIFALKNQTEYNKDNKK
jgi:hypothetical protein